MSRVLQCDAGNSAVKWRLLDGDRVLARGRLRPAEDATFEALLASTEHLDAIWIASVADTQADEALASRLSDRWQVRPLFAASAARTADLINSYPDPSRMGVDRWLAMLGARRLWPGERCCVVDAGSALTIDLVAASGAHEGGFILPGLALMESALLRDTRRVRFQSRGQRSLTPGRDTGSAVQHGAALALCGAIDLALRQAAQSGPLPRLCLCGGDGELLLGLLDRDAVFVEDLVFEGLSVYAEAAAGFR